jgi:hypothetical protein
VEDPAEGEVLHRGEVIVDPDRLPRVPDQLSDPIGLTIGVEAADARRAGGPAKQRDEDLDRGALARSVRTEEAKDFPAVHGERDPRERGRASRVELGQILDLDGGGVSILHGDPPAIR